MSKIEHIIKAETATVESKAECIIINGQIFTYKNTGLTRKVFVNKDKTLVVKVPINTHDQSHNDKEAKLWLKSDKETKAQLAETSLLSNGYILQEYLQTLDDKETEEKLGRVMTMEEIRFATSCRNEVGFDKNGVLKCYDYDEFKAY